MQKHRVLVFSHGHPDFNLGGGELAAYNLFKSIKLHDDIEDAWFIGRMDRGNGPTGSFSMRRENEYLWEQSLGNSFLLKAANSCSVWYDLRIILRKLNPTIIYAHHYLHLGLEYFRVIKQELPNSRLILTLHEYMAICHQHGQMVKRGSNQLCTRESLDDCNRCFPEFSREQFWMRKKFIKDHFEFVDHFVSPSQFLKQRYIDWGIPEEKISVIENGQETFSKLPPRALEPGQHRNRFGFFGQINPFKGIDLLLESIHSIPKKKRKNIIVEIHGANLEHQNDEFKKKIHLLSAPLIEEGCVVWVGSYQPDQIAGRMKNIDWVIIPSIWWENSPMVIQEAFTYGRPLICSNIGGMAEKVQDGINGIHFEARNKISLSETILLAASSKGSELWEAMHNEITPPPSHHEITMKYLAEAEKCK